MVQTKKQGGFDSGIFLATISAGRRNVVLSKEHTIFTQGNASGTVFYIQHGKVRLTVVSVTGEEVAVSVLGEGEFFGEGSLAGEALRMGSATAITDCELLEIENGSMMLALHQGRTFYSLFVAHLLARSFSYSQKASSGY